MTTIAQAKTGTPTERSTACGCLPRRPGWHGRVQSVPRRVASCGPRGWPDGRPARYVSKEALFASATDLRGTCAFTGKLKSEGPLTACDRIRGPWGARSISVTLAAHPARSGAPAGPGSGAGERPMTAWKGGFQEPVGLAGGVGPGRTPGRLERPSRRL
jgi:hypothetical protein